VISIRHFLANGPVGWRGPLLLAGRFDRDPAFLLVPARPHILVLSELGLIAGTRHHHSGFADHGNFASGLAHSAQARPLSRGPIGFNAAAGASLGPFFWKSRAATGSSALTLAATILGLATAGRLAASTSIPSICGAQDAEEFDFFRHCSTFDE